MSRKQSPAFDPVILMTLGIGLLTIAVIMLVTQNLGEQGISIGIGTGFSGRIMVAFITGLTTGGLSCLAVQGGLLASSLAHQIEQDYLGQAAQPKKRSKKNQPMPASPVHSNTALPILLFLAAKLAVYTLLGVLLGWLGSFLTLSPISRALLMAAIGVFMIGNALRMFNVHPIFRYFSIEPPKFITRYIRRTSKGTDTFTPLFLGALTVFIPCGVTQAMMAAALATGSPFTGAALMFAFTLGTSPVFFIVAFLATELGSRLEKFFMRFVAITVLVLGFVTLDNGLNLMGSPYSFTNLTRGLTNTASNSGSSPLPNSDLTLYVRNEGYFPQTLRASANEAVALSLVTDKTYSCSRDFVIPALNFYQLLPDTGTVQVDIPPQPAGTRMFFTCSMGMYTGMIIFE
jgi:sulfite exporter TauE/SafE